jgi:TonB family protein
MNNQSNHAGYGKLALVIIATLTAGAGLILGFQAGQYFFGRSEPAASDAVVNQQNSEGQAVRSAEPVAPESGPESRRETEESPEKLSLKDSAANDPQPELDKARKRQNAGAVENISFPGRRSEVSPPAISGVKRDSMAQVDVPFEINERARTDPHGEQTALTPQQPVKFEPRASNIVRKSGDVLQNTAAFRPQPIYPKSARDADIKGNVTVEVVINEEGSVISARAISGPDQLREAAVAAARRWKWLPTRVDRERARVIGTITFRFNN